MDPLCVVEPVEIAAKDVEFEFPPAPPIPPPPTPLPRPPPIEDNKLLDVDTAFDGVPLSNGSCVELLPPLCG